MGRFKVDIAHRATLLQNEPSALLTNIRGVLSVLNNEHFERLRANAVERVFTREKASAYGLTGWVRNSTNGTVSTERHRLLGEKP
jgi:hypothetical protein